MILLSLEENKSLVRRYVEEILNKGDETVVDEIIASDRIFHRADKDLKGPEEFKQYINMARTGLPDLHFSIEDLIAERDKVVFCWTFTGTHRGEFMGIPATNKKVAASGASVIRISEGRIAEIWPYWDRLSLMQQLGVAPSPK